MFHLEKYGTHVDLDSANQQKNVKQHDIQQNKDSMKQHGMPWQKKKYNNYLYMQSWAFLASSPCPLSSLKRGM